MPGGTSARTPGADPLLQQELGGFSALRLFLCGGVVECRDLFQILGFEDLIAIDAAEIIHSVASHQEFRALVFTERHRKLEYPLF